MKSQARLLLATVALAVVATTPAPPPAPPVIQLHKTANAAFATPAEQSPIFILVIGSDIREGDPRQGRADTLQLVALDAASGSGTIVGIPRDSYVPIPGSGRNKINASLFFGGPERTVQTVSELSGIPIHYWAIVEFSRFRMLVDTLGGIEVDVPYPMADRFSGAFFDAGPRHMNGAEALAFTRNRMGVPGGDFGRSLNGGRMLLAALHKFRAEANSPLGLARYLGTFHSLVESNVPVSDLLRLASLGRRIDPARVQNIVLPGSAGSAGGASVVHLAPGAFDIFAKIREDGTL